WAGIFPGALGSGVAQVVPTLFGEGFQTLDHVWMLRGKIVRFGQIVVEVEEGEIDLVGGEFAGFAAVTRRLWVHIFVGQMELPFAAAHGLKLLSPIIEVG